MLSVLCVVCRFFLNTSTITWISVLNILELVNIQPPREGEMCLYLFRIPCIFNCLFSSYVLPRLPKLCYTVMKDSQLRQKLKEYHLPSSGQRSVIVKAALYACIFIEFVFIIKFYYQSLISRLKEFTLQYNAQCDSPQPKTSEKTNTVSCATDTV